MNKYILIGILSFLVLISSAFVNATPLLLSIQCDNNVTDLANSSRTITNVGVTYALDVPIYNKSGTGGAGSCNFGGNTTSYLNLSSGINTTNDIITITYWFKGNASTAGKGFNIDSSSAGTHMISNEFSGGKAIFYTNVNFYQYVTDNGYARDNAWRLWVMTANLTIITNPDINITINLTNTTLGTNAPGATNDLANLNQIGQGETGTKGLTDNIRIYRGKLNSTELNNLYNYGNETGIGGGSGNTPTITINSPNNQTAQYYSTNNNITFNTTATDMGNQVNTTHYLYNSTNFLISQNNGSNTSANYTSTFNNLPIGIYYLNATAQNNSITNKTETITVYIYNLTNGSITNPIGGNQFVRFMNISYINTTSTPITINVSWYNITLLNESQVFNRTIKGNNSNNLSYYWDVYAENLTVGKWYIKIQTIDIYGGSINSTTSFNLTANAQINVTARTKTNNVAIQNFTGWYIDNLTGINTTFNTTNYNKTLYIIKDRVHIVYLESENYAITNTTNTVTSNYTQLTNYSNNTIFYLYETNTLNITFYNEATNTAIGSTTSCYLDMISSLYSANQSTTNGTMYLVALTPNSYVLRYTCTGYTVRFYSLDVNNQTYNQLNLYVINSTNYANISIYVVDEVARPVENAIVKSLKYNLLTNTYILQESGITDVAGKSIQTLTKFDEYYKFVVEYNGETKLTTTPAYITTDSVTLQISFDVDFGDDYYTYKNIASTIVFNPSTDNFRFDFNDATGSFSQFCLYVYRGVNQSQLLTNSTCTATSSGTILLGVNPINGTTYSAKAYYDDSGMAVYLGGASYTYPDATTFQPKTLFLQFLITLGAALTAVYNVPLAIILVPTTLLLGHAISLNVFGLNALIGLQVIAIILAVLMGLRRS